MEEKQLLNKVKEETEKIMEEILKEGIEKNNIEFLDKIVDIHKDISNEEYWKKEEDNMRYRGYGRDSYEEYDNYGNYGRRSRDSRGRYTDGGYSEGGYSEGSYSARGYDAKYRGHEMLDEMYHNYGAYSEGREQYGRGNYGAKQETMESFEYMLKSFKDFFKHLKQEASSQEEVEMLKKTAREISEM